MDLLCEICWRKHELKAIANKKLQKKRLEVIYKYIKLMNKKEDTLSWTVSEFKTALKALKIESDGPIPGKKQDLVDMHDKVKWRKESVMMENSNLAVESID